MLHHKQFNPSQIFLEKEFLYKTHSGQLRAHKRKRGKTVLDRKPAKTFGNINDSDITYFTKKDDRIFAGRRNGQILLISTSNETEIVEQIDRTSANRIEFVDFQGDLFVATTLNRTTLWRTQYELDMPYLEPIVELSNSGNKCLRLAPDTNQLATGKYNERSRTALRLTDLET